VVATLLLVLVVQLALALLLELPLELEALDLAALLEPTLVLPQDPVRLVQALPLVVLHQHHTPPSLF
jgi:hypothetical protein